MFALRYFNFSKFLEAFKRQLGEFYLLAQPRSQGLSFYRPLRAVR